MKLTDLLGLPLDTALETAEAQGLRAEGIVMTSAGGNERKIRESGNGFEKRVIACRGNILIAGTFRTSRPAEKTLEETGGDE